MHAGIKIMLCWNETEEAMQRFAACSFPGFTACAQK